MANRSSIDPVIRQVLAEEEVEKKRRKASKAPREDDEAAQRRSAANTVEQHHDEGGPIRERMVGVAQAKRASKRRGQGGISDTDLVEDVEAVEEELHAEEEDGVKFEAFNLKEERQKGYFDEVGNYVEREERGDDEEADAWLQSDEAKIVDAKILERIKSQHARMEVAEQAAPLSAIQTARLQWQIAQLLKDGENVTKALKRLGGTRSQAQRFLKRRKTKPSAAGGVDGPKASAGQEEKKEPQQNEADKEAFERLTETASALLDAGDVDVYSRDRTYFKQAASVYIDMDEEEEAEAEQSVGMGDNTPRATSLLPQGKGKAAYEDADEDMFAEDDEAKERNGDENAKKYEHTERHPHPAGTKGTQNEGYASWPVKELRRVLTERGEDTSGIVEKSDLVAKVAAVATQGPAPASTTTTSAGVGGTQAPAGYAFDPGSGMWKSEESGMYWDAASGGFYNSGDGKWYAWDAAAGWVEWVGKP